jgi:hypothetical protein
MACRWRARCACVSAAGGGAGRKNVLGFGVRGVVALYSVGSARVRIRSVATQAGGQVHSNGPHGSCRVGLCTIVSFGLAIGPRLVR